MKNDNMNSEIKEAAEKYADELIECQSIQLYEKGWLISVLTHFYEEVQPKQKSDVWIKATPQQADEVQNKYYE